MARGNNKLNVGTRVKIVNLPNNVNDEVRKYEGAIGEIKSFGSPSPEGLRGSYVRMDDGRWTLLKAVL